jgi:structural maintenance of chromosome 2
MRNLAEYELKDKEVELTQEREDRLGQIEKAVKDAKKQAAEKAKSAREVRKLRVFYQTKLRRCSLRFLSFSQAESRWQTLSLELESLKADIVAAQEGVVQAEAGLKKANDEEDSRQIKVGEVKALYDEAKATLIEFEDRLAHCSSELSEIKHQKSALAKKAEACALEAKKLSVAIARFQKDKHSVEKLVANLLKNHAWIESEKSEFGVEGGD